MKTRVFIISLIIFCLVFANFVSVNVNTANASALTGTAKQSDYDVNKFKLLFVLGFGGGRTTVAYSPSEDKLAVGDNIGVVHIIDCHSSYKEEKQLYTSESLNKSSSDVTDISWAPDGNKLSASYDDGTIKIWDVNAGICLKDFLAHNGSLHCISWSPDGNKIASGSAYAHGYSSSIKIWNATTGELLRALKYRDIICDVAWNPNSTKLASCCVYKSINIWDVTTGECVREIVGKDYHSVVWSSDGTKVIAGGSVGDVYEFSSGGCVETLNEQ